VRTELCAAVRAPPVAKPALMTSRVALALGSVVASTVWKNTGYYMLFFLAGLAGVPQDLLDAATIDGAWRRFRNVTLPMLSPSFAFVVPIAVLNALTQVDHVVTMTQGGPADATNLCSIISTSRRRRTMMSVLPLPRR
jgi:ABC-type sugar transport system permease subunit